MKFTGFAATLAFAGIVSAAALPQAPKINGATEGMRAAAEGTLAGLTHGVKRQLEALHPVTGAAGNTLHGVTGTVGSTVGTGEGAVGGVAGAAEHTVANTAGALKKRQLGALYPVTGGAGSTLNGVTGIAGSVAGTGESAVAGTAGTVENTIANSAGALNKRQDDSGLVPEAEGLADDTLGGLKARQLDTLYPVTEATGSSLNGITGLTGSAVGTAESTVSGAAKTAENVVSNTAGSGLLHERQLGNLPTSLDQTVESALTGLSGNPTGLYGALSHLRTIVNAGDLTHEDLTNMPHAIQNVISHLTVA